MEKASVNNLEHADRNNDAPDHGLNDAKTAPDMIVHGLTSDAKSSDNGAKLQSPDNEHAADLSTLPKGYFYSSYFLGTFVAIGLGLLAGQAGFAFVAPNLATINADLGPDSNIQWVALIHPVGLSVGMTIVGRLSDVFGRRWFFIGGALLALIGCLISALAPNVPVLIFAAVLKALAAATQLSCFYTLSELVPVKYRYLGNGMLYFWLIPGSGFGPVISESIITSSSWRNIYWILVGVNSASALCWFFFYHPPTFTDKHGASARRWEYVRDFDYVGVFLFAAGLVLFLFGISWGGGTYPWSSPIVISFIVVGFLLLVSFFTWEVYAPLREPLVPVSLLVHRPYVVSVVMAGIGAGVYYCGAIIWPPLTRILYSGGNVRYSSYLSSLNGLGVIAGQMIGGALATRLPSQKWQAIITAVIGGALLASVSVVTPYNRDLVCALLFLAATFLGYNEMIALSNALISIPNNQEIGAAGGLATSGRASIAALCQTVYNTILANRLLVTIPARVIPAATDAGLPATSVKQLLAALAAGGTPAAWKTVPGLTPQIQQAAVLGNQLGYADAYRTLFLSSLGFVGLNVVCACLSPNVGELMTGKVTATLGKQAKRDDKASEVA